MPAQRPVLRAWCPGPLGSCSSVCPPVVLCSVRGVLGHSAAVYRCARLVHCVACAVAWATWLLFTSVLARRVVLRVRCLGPLGSCSPLCTLGVLCCVCGVRGHLAPVHRGARSVCCVGCALSSNTWPLFTCAHAWCVVLCVLCPGPLGSFSPACMLRVLCCMCGVLGHLASVHLCARSSLLCCVCGVVGHLAPIHRGASSVCCAVCAMSWATWLRFTGVLARPVVLCVWCPRPLGSCSQVCSLGVLCSVLCVPPPGPLASCSPVCALGVLCVMCRASLPGAHTSIRTAAFRSRQGLCTLRARTRPFGQRLFCSWQGLGTLRAGTIPSGRRLVRSREGRGSLPAAHSSICTAANVAWHLFTCSGSLRVVRVFRVCGTRWPLSLRTCPCALVVAGGVPLWRARCPGRSAAPRQVRSLSVLQSAFPTPWCLFPPQGLSPPDLLGGCSGHAEAGREPGSLCLPLAPAEVGTLGSLCFLHVRGPAMALSLAGPSGVGLRLRALLSFAFVDPVTDASGFLYRPSFNRGFGRCTGTVSCGPGQFLFRVRGRNAWFPCVCAWAYSCWPGQAGRPPGRVLVCLTFPVAAWSFCHAQPPPGWGCPLLGRLFAFLRFSFLFPPSLCAPLSSAFFGFWPQVPWALPLCSPPRPVFSFSEFLGFPCGLLGLVFVSSRPPLPVSPPSPLVFLFLPFPPPPCLLCGSPAARLSVCSFGCSFAVAAPPPPLLGGSRSSSLPLGVPCFSSAALLLPSCLAFVRCPRYPLPPPHPLVRALCLVLSGVAALCRPPFWFFAVPCCPVLCCVSCCGASPCCVADC